MGKFHQRREGQRRLGSAFTGNVFGDQHHEQGPPPLAAPAQQIPAGPGEGRREFRGHQGPLGSAGGKQPEGHSQPGGIGRLGEPAIKHDFNFLKPLSILFFHELDIIAQFSFYRKS